MLLAFALQNMKRLNLQAVMIDLDGTMADTIGDFEVALSRALANLHIPIANRVLIERSITSASMANFPKSFQV